VNKAALKNRSVLTLFYTIIALLAFAANSVLCRMALGTGTIDAASFSTVRLISGATILLLISSLTQKRQIQNIKGNWISAGMLFLYAVAFSFAYISLDTGTGALILFASVQATMIIYALISGERPNIFEWLGLFIALVGLTYLVFPGLTSPSLTGSLLMAVSGISWGIYTLRGRSASNPLADTKNNFVRSIPFVLLISLITIQNNHISPEGVLLAVLSGALASGVGYVIWYAALRGLTATRAATVQLSVPVLAALGGVTLLSEEITLRLILSVVLILGGVALAVTSKKIMKFK
jgi:drug/metabolite transporter (DMT)-like permease